VSLEELASRYIASADKVLTKICRVEKRLTVDPKNVDIVLEQVSAYLEDAKYYKAQKRFETSLTSVAYCEGLLDTLRLLGAVEFEWPIRLRSER
jgi:hypothetical protein